MTLSSIGGTALSFAGGIHFELTAPSHGVTQAPARRRPWAMPLRRGLGLRNPAHELLVDAHGVWAWAPGDSFSAASRHASVQRWIETNAGCDVHLWVASDLMRSPDGIDPSVHQSDAALRSNARRALVERHGETAASWPLATWKNNATLGVLALAGIDLESLRVQALRHGVRLQSVMPWWYHAFVEAKRCVNALNHVARAQVCVVEGRQIAWVVASHGLLREVRQCSLESARVGALKTTIERLLADAPERGATTVVLGQGLLDGARTCSLDSLVLGRLDGERPPQWLRPGSSSDIH